MVRKKKEAKLTFIPVGEHLKEFTANTIPQVTTSLSYVKKWAKISTIQEDLPDDYSNVINFFKDIKKLSPQGFQPKKFKELWDKYNMLDITDYDLVALGVPKESTDEDEYN